MSNSSVAIVGISIRLNGNEIGRTDANGDFQLSVPIPPNDRISLVFVDDMNSMYFMATKVCYSKPLLTSLL